MTARSTSRSRASCCCPCGLAPVVTVAAGTTWGHATPCYASLAAVAMCMCVFSKTLYLDRQRCTVFWPHTKTKISRTRGHTTHRPTRTDIFFEMYQLETRFARIIPSSSLLRQLGGTRASIFHGFAFWQRYKRIFSYNVAKTV